MSDLQARFNKAVELVQKQPADGPFQTTVQDKLVFYSLFKQATEGPCSTKKPSMLNPVAKAKWDAWSKLGNLSKEQAMQKYIDTLVELVNKTPASPFKEEVMKTVVPRKAATTQASGSQGTKGKVIIYGDLMSQPTRAVLWFCLLNNINHEFKAIKLVKGEHLKPEYLKLNPHKKVPCIDDSGFIVYESHAIMRYLATRYRTTEQWFPHNLSSRTRIDQYLDWHHSNLRRGASVTVFSAVFAGPTGRQIPEAIIEEGKNLLVNSLQALETVWLKNSDFLAGSSRPSIADLSAYEEIANLTQLIQYDLSPYPKVQKWVKAMEALPHYAKAHEALAKVAQALQAKKKEEQPAGEQTPQAKL